MGIGNTTTSSAVASVLLGCDPLLVTGRGAGLSDSGLSRKLEAIKSDKASPPGSGRSAQCALYAWRVRYCRNGRPLPWRRAVSGSVLIDGVISSVAALLAVKICPASKKAMLATHVSAEPAGCMILDAIGLEPMITAGMRLGRTKCAVRDSDAGYGVQRLPGFYIRRAFDRGV